MSDGFELVRVRNGAWGIRSLAYDEVCHPGVGPRAEAEALYVRGLDLPRRFGAHAVSGDSRDEFVVWDIGLGGGANAAAVIDAAAASGPGLRVVSFDRSVGQLEFALRHDAELACLGALAGPAARLIEDGEVLFQHGNAAVRWTRVLGDFTVLVALQEPPPWPAPHAILFDPHSPIANPEMWTLPLFQALHGRLDPNRPCGLATYSRSTAIRASLLLAGFVVGAGGSTGAKEETTLAANRLEWVGRPLDARWLERARRSRAAEPWTTPPFGGRPLSDATWECLRNQPQFRITPG